MISKTMGGHGHQKKAETAEQDRLKAVAQSAALPELLTTATAEAHWEMR